MLRSALWYLALLFIGMVIPARGGNPPHRQWTACAFPPAFEHISVEQGLSQNTVHCMIQDRKGFLWMGTDGGLNRYDGFHFQVFHPEKGNPNSLLSDRIHHLMEDHRGYIWIANLKSGINILDPETMQMVSVPPSKTPGGLPTGSVDAFAEDPQGNVWLGTEDQGLCRVSREWRMGQPLTFQHFQSQPQDPRGAPPGRVKSLFFDHQGTLWIGSMSRGLGHLVADSGDGRLLFDYYPHDAKHPDTSSPSIIHGMAEDHFGTLWMGGDNGVFTLDPVKGIFRRWYNIEGSAANIANTRVTDVVRDSTGTMWLASDGMGLLKALPRINTQDSVRLQRFGLDPKDPRSLSGNGLQCIFVDRSGVLWASSYQSGLSKLVLNPGRYQDREKPSLFQYRNIAADPNSLSGNMISAVGQDRFGNLWIGTDGFGVNRVIPPSKPGEAMRFEHFRYDPTRRPGSLQTDVILGIHLDSQKQLWLTSYNGGIIRVDQSSPTAQPTFTHFWYEVGNPTCISSNFVRDVLEDGTGGLWVAFNDNGLNHFDPKRNLAKRYAWGGGAKASMCETIYAMAKDGFGTIWMATPMGLNRFNPATEEFRAYTPGSGQGLSDGFVNTVFVDETNTLWAGTAGGGLNKAVIPPWDGPEPRFTSFGTREGLPSLAVMSMVSDRKGNLFLATSRALCRFNIQEGKGHPFMWQRELRKAEFIWNSRFASPSGEIFFGSNDGLTLFAPEDIALNPTIPPVAISGFQILNTPHSLWSRTTRKADGDQLQEITLSPSDSMVSFDFAALNFVAPEKNRYAYMMEGLDKTWNEIGNNHFVSYTALPPGNYVLHVKASNCDGIWNEDGFRIKVRVLPPWYKSWWFHTLLALAGGGMVYGIIRIRLQVLQNRNRLLKQIVDERTMELAQANEALRNQSLTDPLTGLRNRRFIYTCMPEDVARVQRVQRDAAMNNINRMKANVDVLFLMVDLDHFKQVNDRHGHHAGDLVLQQMSELLRKAVRETDTITRWGGEEFLIVARNAARADAILLPERVRSSVEKHLFDVGGEDPIHCTCSIGFSVFPFFINDFEIYSWEQVVDIADACLYAAKHSGRNAWVGIVPDACETHKSSERVIPKHVADLIKAQIFPVLTSLKTPLQWSSKEDES